MPIFRAGATTPLQPINKMLEVQHGLQREAVQQRIATRKEHNTPDDDLEHPLEDPGEFEPVPEWSGIKVSLRAMSNVEWPRAQEAMATYEDSSEADAGSKRLQAIIAFLQLAVAEVDGIEGEDGTNLSLEELCLSNDAEARPLIFALYGLALFFQVLPGSKKKAFC